MRKTWEGINSLINNRKKNRNTINILKSSDNGGLSHNPHEHTNILNTHFASIGIKRRLGLPTGSPSKKKNPFAGSHRALC